MKRSGDKQKPKKQFFSIEDEAGVDGWPLPAIVPIVFSEYKSRIEAECCFGVYDVLRGYLDEFGGRLFAPESLRELDRRVQPYLKENGYERGEGILRYYKTFALWKKEDLDVSAIRRDSVLLTSETAKTVLKNRTDFDPDELLAKKLPAAMTVKRGELLSIASVNEHSPGQRLLEATVYTLPRERRKGYGRSNTALLCKSLLEKKKGVAYCCSSHNGPSLALARSLGFRPECRIYAIDAYKTEDGEE